MGVGGVTEEQRGSDGMERSWDIRPGFLVTSRKT